MKDYKEKLHREKTWHTQGHRSAHLLNSRLFYSKERQAFNYAFARNEMQRFIDKILQKAPLRSSPPSLLIAPIGGGNDLRFLSHVTQDITGIDIAQEALVKIKDSRELKLVVCDMKDMGCFVNDQFDLVVSPLFFHHFNGMHCVFLRELCRVMKPGGHFVALEPSILHPFSWVTRSIRRVVGNITAQVDDEAPFLASRLVRAMRENGLEDIQLRAASFSHNRLPVWAARVNNLLMRPLMSMPVARQFGWLCLFYGRKRIPLVLPEE